MVAFANNQPVKNDALNIPPRSGLSTYFARNQTRFGCRTTCDEADWDILMGRINGHASTNVLAVHEMVRSCEMD